MCFDYLILQNTYFFSNELIIALKLIDQKWDDKEIDITYDKTYNSSSVISLKDYKKKPPSKNDGDNA